MHIQRFAVIGNPIKHSRSPAIHRLFARQTGITLEYDRIESPHDQFEATVSQFFTQGGRGLNITVPFKQEAWQLASAHLSPRAKVAQAVNTLWMQDSALHGCNTDGVGLVQDLERLGVQCRGARILMIGAGGAARGVMGPLIETGCAHLHIVNRTAKRAHALLTAWQDVYPDSKAQISTGGLPEAARAGGWDLVINASSSSLGQTAPELPTGLYAARALAYDMMYGPAPTPFMLQAQADGASLTSDGLGMLVAQAAESFRIWHNVQPEIAPVIDTIRAEFNSSQP